MFDAILDNYRTIYWLEFPSLLGLIIQSIVMGWITKLSRMIKKGGNARRIWDKDMKSKKKKAKVYEKDGFWTYGAPHGCNTKASAEAAMEAGKKSS